MYHRGEPPAPPPSPSGLPLLNAIAQIVVGDEIQACGGHETLVRHMTRGHHSLESSAPDFGLVFFPEANHLSILERSYLRQPQLGALGPANMGRGAHVKPSTATTGSLINSMVKYLCGFSGQTTGSHERRASERTCTGGLRQFKVKARSSGEQSH
jgi:hypothetical protein